jgi:hypothetical protein
MEGRKGELKEERKDWLSFFWTFSSSGVSNKHKNRTFVISGFDFNPSSGIKKTTCGVTSSVQPVKNQIYPSPLFCMVKDTGSISKTSHMLTLMQFEEPHVCTQCSDQNYLNTVSHKLTELIHTLYSLRVTCLSAFISATTLCFLRTYQGQMGRNSSS